MTSTTAQTQPDTQNPVGLQGLAFLEFTGPNPAAFDQTFKGFGLSKIRKHSDKNIWHYNQNAINFLLNQEKGGFAEDFGNKHGQSVCSMGFWVTNTQKAFDEAVRRGARSFDPKGAHGDKEQAIPAVYGVGDSLIYFVEAGSDTDNYFTRDFQALPEPERVPDKGFQFVDHLTNNVYKGTMGTWSDFYKGVFGFTEIQYFDIKGKKTGLTSFALKSPCKTFSIPINEGNEEKSQIEEYLREYKGAGVQHIALATNDLLDSLDKLQGSGIETLDIDEDYYEEAFQRVPNVTEDRQRIQNHQVLIDGDEKGYLLQIFTKNLFGPVFIEMIQRKNHHAFGEGNFGALFKSIERDQERRGVL